MYPAPQNQATPLDPGLQTQEQPELGMPTVNLLDAPQQDIAEETSAQNANLPDVVLPKNEQ
jgi:hypothetical protein